jgi:glycine cleavage system transcriptional repressor
MTEQLLVTAIGEDRPGIVARLTETFVEHNANVEESRMSILGGEFAAIILVTIDSGTVVGLKQKLDSLKSEGITVLTKNTRASDQQRFAQHGLFEVNLTGADHEGIVHKVSRFLTDHQINIQTMDTETVPAPITGTPLFTLKATILVPVSISAKTLEEDLHHIGKEESVEITILPCSAQRAKAGSFST